MSLTVILDPRGLSTFQAAADQLSGPQFRKVMRESLTAAGLKTRTQVRRALREQTNVKAAKDVNDRTRSYLAPGGALEYSIVATAKPLPIDRISDLTVRVGPGGGVQAAPWQVLRQFQRSFVIQGEGGPRYVARLSDKRMPMRRLYGPSMAKELVKDESLHAFERVGLPELRTQIATRIERLLGKP